MVTLDSFINTLEAIGNIHDFDNEHCLRTSALAVAIGRRLNGGERLSKENLQMLDYAARIHDIGRVGIDNAILSKTSRLTKSQRAAVREHVQIGYDLLSKSNLPQSITEAVLYHHEHWDGSGYPMGLSGLGIPLFARIVCIADTWDGIISERPYHKARLNEIAMDEMSKCIGWFDPKLYAVFLSVLQRGELGEVAP